MNSKDSNELSTRYYQWIITLFTAAASFTLLTYPPTEKIGSMVLGVCGVVILVSICFAIFNPDFSSGWYEKVIVRQTTAILGFAGVGIALAIIVFLKIDFFESALLGMLYSASVFLLLGLDWWGSLD